MFKIFLSLILASSAFARFPDQVTPIEYKNWELVRDEGTDNEYLIKNAVGYTKKAQEKVFRTSPEIISHFENQTKIVKQLRNERMSDQVSSLALLGDIMWIRRGWDDFLDSRLKSYLESFDFVFANLETQIDKSNNVPETLPFVAKFNSDPRLITNFSRPDGASLFSALSIANNHALDLGEEGLRATMKFLREQKIPFSGAREINSQESNYVIVEKNGIRIGFYATTYGVNGKPQFTTSTVKINYVQGLAYEDTTPYDLTGVSQALEQMQKDKVDLKIVSLHWGHEYEMYPTAKQGKIAREIVGMGADILMGSHPHVQQPVEICRVNGFQYGTQISDVDVNEECSFETKDGRARKALIVYSLGNFTTNMYEFFSEVGIIQNIKIWKTSSGVNWMLDTPRLVYNHKKSKIVGGVKTLLIDDYVKESCLTKKGCSKKFYEKLIWLNKHVGI